MTVWLHSSPSLRSTAHRSYALDLLKAIRLSFDHVEDLVAECTHQLLRVDRPNAADHSRGKVFFDALGGGGGGGPQEPRLELLSVGAVVDPLPGCRDPFTGGNCRSVADDRHEIAVAARLCSQYAEPVLRIMEGDPFDKARQHFLVLRCRLWLHEAGPAPKTPRLLTLGVALCLRTLRASAHPWAVSGAAARRSILPEVLKPAGRKRRIALRRNNRSMAEITLDCSGVVAIIGKLVAA